jgi:hypothetical protein
MSENLQQQELIQKLASRVDHMEGLLQAWQDEQRQRQQQQRGWFGFAARGVAGDG